MKITLRILCQADAKAALASDSVVSRECDLGEVVFELDSVSEALDRVLQLTRDCSGSWFNPVMTFTRRELDCASYLQLDCRKTVPETEGDYELNFARLEETPFRSTGDGTRIKLLDRTSLTKVAIKPNVVAGVDEWMAEFIIGSAVARAFEEEGLTGYSLRPVWNPKTVKEHKGIFQLYSEATMPPAHLDLTTVPADGGGVRQLGCLVCQLDAGAQLPDFNRTAEDWSSNSMPLWVVSQRVRDCFQRNKLRGWAFRPVVAAGSELHEEYLRMWKDVFERVSANPRNFF